MHARYHEPLQLADVCRALGVSAESLRLSFQRHAEMPPMRYLKRLRLLMLNEKLRSCDPRTENVKTLAYRCGLRELGRCAAAYRQMYGRLPSEDLRRRLNP